MHVGLRPRSSQTGDALKRELLSLQPCTSNEAMKYHASMHDVSHISTAKVLVSSMAGLPKSERLSRSTGLSSKLPQCFGAAYNMRSLIFTALTDRCSSNPQHKTQLAMLSAAYVYMKLYL